MWKYTILAKCILYWQHHSTHVWLKGGGFAKTTVVYILTVFVLYHIVWHRIECNLDSRSQATVVWPRTTTANVTFIYIYIYYFLYFFLIIIISIFLVYKICSQNVEFQNAYTMFHVGEITLQECEITHMVPQPHRFFCHWWIYTLKKC